MKVCSSHRWGSAQPISTDRTNFGLKIIKARQKRNLCIHETALGRGRAFSDVCRAQPVYYEKNTQFLFLFFFFCSVTVLRWDDLTILIIFMYILFTKWLLQICLSSFSCCRLRDSKSISQRRVKGERGAPWFYFLLERSSSAD